MKQMQYLEKMLGKKVVSKVTLDQALENDPEQFKKISELCILAETGIDELQVNDALDELSNYTPNRQTAYVSSIKDKGVRKIAWTYFKARKWQFVVELPEYIRSFRKNGELLYFPVH